MAIYHASTKPISRTAGRSSVAAAAYRAGAALVDERTGLVHDYTRKGGVVSADIITADGETLDRAALWNAAEVAEKRKDARTAREWIVALPSELDAGQRHELALSFGAELARRYGVAVEARARTPRLGRSASRCPGRTEAAGTGQAEAAAGPARPWKSGARGRGLSPS